MGSKHKLSEDFLSELHADWKKHGVASIDQMRKEDNTHYVKMVASLVPKDIDLVSTDATPKRIESDLELANKLAFILRNGLQEAEKLEGQPTKSPNNRKHNGV